MFETSFYSEVNMHIYCKKNKNIMKWWITLKYYSTYLIFHIIQFRFLPIIYYIYHYMNGQILKSSPNILMMVLVILW